MEKCHQHKNFCGWKRAVDTTNQMPGLLFLFIAHSLKISAPTSNYLEQFCYGTIIFGSIFVSVYRIFKFSKAIPCSYKRQCIYVLVYGCHSSRQPKTYVKPEASITVFELPMMGVVPPETCWAIKKHWNNKFYYTVASCWFFLWDLCYDARFHEHQTGEMSVRFMLRCTNPWTSNWWNVYEIYVTMNESMNIKLVKCLWDLCYDARIHEHRTGEMSVRFMLRCTNLWTSNWWNVYEIYVSMHESMNIKLVKCLRLQSTAAGVFEWL
jgi:hypothetical protein